jgi:diketogulonate reductase-like aldo/keto reductase
MSTNPKHIEENLGALDVELSAEDFERLNRLA